MAAGKSEHVSRTSPKKGNREAGFFDKLTNSTVVVTDLDGKQFGGKLVWVGPYSVILERKGVEELYWKHALKGMKPGNGRGTEPIESLGLGSSGERAKRGAD